MQLKTKTDPNHSQSHIDPWVQIFSEYEAEGRKDADSAT